MKKFFLVFSLLISSLYTIGAERVTLSPVSLKAGESTTVTMYFENSSTTLKTFTVELILPAGLYIPAAGGKDEGDYDTDFVFDANWNPAMYSGTPFTSESHYDSGYGTYVFDFSVNPANSTDYITQTSKPTWMVTFTICSKSDAVSGDITFDYVVFKTEDDESVADADLVGSVAATVSVGEYAATFKSTGSTICAESALDFSAVSGAKLYAVSEITSTSAKLTEVEDGIADANKGYLVMGLSGDQKIPFTDGSSSYSGENKLVGVTAPTAIASDAKIYVLSDGEFHPCSGGTLAAGKAYLNCSGIEGLAKSITFSFVETTGIRNISSDEDASNTPIYNLSGMRVKKAQKGVYIRNGKKYVVE
jgi:hypothetical protein